MADKDIIKGVFADLGLDQIGLLPFDAVAPHLLDVRIKSRLPERAAGLILVLFPYRLPQYQDRNIARFAVVPDYHAVCGELLQTAADRLAERFSGHAFVPFIDHSPIPEVWAAAAAGLGLVGRHGLLINERYGSWVVIGELVTTLPLEASAGVVRRCDDCGACTAACPAKVLGSGGGKRNGCVSRLTQKKGELTVEEQALIRRADSAWGCDRCQEVCPLNADTLARPLADFAAGAIDTLCEDTPLDGRVYAWRGPEVLRRNLRLCNLRLRD